VQCDFWDITVYLLLPGLKYYYEKEGKKRKSEEKTKRLYLWLLEITKVRIRFRNYLFKADKRISHPSPGT